jgi:putative transposase
MHQILTGPRGPGQRTDTERLMGSIRREDLDHVIVLNEGHLRRLLVSYLNSRRRSCTHMSLAIEWPDDRPAQPAEQGAVDMVPEVGDCIIMTTSACLRDVRGCGVSRNCIT